jgi:hypothetical protein
LPQGTKNVDARDKPGHDDLNSGSTWKQKQRADPLGRL